MVAQQENSVSMCMSTSSGADNDKYQRDFFRNRVSVKLGQKGEEPRNPPGKA
jgi:hypothetical protein